MRHATMPDYVRFLLIGLLLGLFTEFELKLVAGINPSAFIIALFAYPVIITLAYAGNRFVDHAVSSTWKGDIVHYVGSGFVGLGVEWGMLGNGPGSNAFQLGMFTMWTTFCFGPRVLTRNSSAIKKSVRGFWIAFGVAAVLLTAGGLLAPNEKAKIVVAVLGLSASYFAWSLWLLMLGWRSRHSGSVENTKMA